MVWWVSGVVGEWYVWWVSGVVGEWCGGWWCGGWSGVVGGWVSGVVGGVGWWVGSMHLYLGLLYYWYSWCMHIHKHGIQCVHLSLLCVYVHT